MDEQDVTKILWKTFSQTGKISAYLLFRAIRGKEDDRP